MATTVHDDQVLDRRSDVWERRVRGETVREIAKELGIGVGTVHADLEAVRAELDENSRCRAEIERSVGAGRLDKVSRKLMATVDLVDDPGELSTIANALARIEERRSKLLGLDAASKTELTGAEGGPLKVEDARNALLSKLSGLAASEPTEGEAQQPDQESDA